MNPTIVHSKTNRKTAQHPIPIIVTIQATTIVTIPVIKIKAPISDSPSNIKKKKKSKMFLYLGIERNHSIKLEYSGLVHRILLVPGQ